MMERLRVVADMAGEHDVDLVQTLAGSCLRCLQTLIELSVGSDSNVVDHDFRQFPSPIDVEDHGAGLLSCIAK